MRLEQSFPVEAPIDAVWAALVDPQRVASCLPGAQLGEPSEDGSFNGTFKVKLGPTTAEYRGTLKIDERDDDAHRVTMLADGRDRRGQGGAKATIVSALTADGTTTTVRVDTDYAITGRLASFSRGGMIEDISKRLLGQFASCLQERLGESTPTPVDAGTGTPPPPPEPPAADPFDAGGLVGDVVLDRVKAVAPLAVLALVIGVLYGRARRRA